MTERLWAPIRYRDFHDIPRMVVVVFGESAYLLDCPFDDSIDDYPSHFEVYLLPMDVERRLDELSWVGLPAMARRIGRVAVDQVEFDPSSRESLSSSFLERLES